MRKQATMRKAAKIIKNKIRHAKVADVEISDTEYKLCSL